MLQHRRTLIIAFATLLLVSIYRFHHISQHYESPLWIHRGRNDGPVLNNTLGFEKIFVINLPSRRDRRDGMTVAGAVSHLNFTFVEGSTEDSAISSSFADRSSGEERAGAKLPHSAFAGARGSWRSHMNVLQAIVGQSLGSALVLEDDVDWDVRLKAQMREFAAASRTWLHAHAEDAKRKSSSHSSEASVLSGSKPRFDDTIRLPSGSFSSMSMLGRRRNGSPYGDDWDVLWLGHCGADLPATREVERKGEGEGGSGDGNLPSLVVSISDDATVPAPKHLKPHPFALLDDLAEAYPVHTRVVHAANGNVCSLAYAVSQSGARKLLWRFNREGFVDQWDLMLRDYCMGKYERRDGEDMRGEAVTQAYIEPVCLTVQPPLISHHYAGEEGGASVSNIRGQGGGLARAKKGTPYIRFSVQENLRRLVAGVPVDELVDQLPDKGDTLW
ncbi:hypothetical protein GGR51DRAFT_554783 [Nemania sp. FL0031]|nr:hypothetical protein GGR51DRAFT_554783 [Nemania sp. FL0031]